MRNPPFMRRGLSCSEVAFSDFRLRLQHIHPEGPLKKMGPLSGMVWSLRRGLNRATLGVLVIDEDRCPCVKLLPDLEDFGRQRDVLDAVVGPFAGHERFDDSTQGFRTKHMMGNNHRGEAPSLCTDSAFCTSGSVLLVLELFVSRSGLACRCETVPVRSTFHRI
jgi:hypothetical protein